MKTIKLHAEREYYTAIFLIPALALFLIILAGHAYIILGAYALLCLWTLVGPKQAIYALSLNYVILLLNPSVYELPGQLGVLRWLVLFLAGLRVLPLVSMRIFRLLLPLLLFFLIVVILSWATSPNFQISLLKVTVFAYCAATVLVAFDSLDENGLNDTMTWFLSLSAAVMVLSLPTLLIPKIGFFLNAKGFQGILNQPQAFGCFLAPLAAFLAARLLLRKDHSSTWLWTLGGMAASLIFLSRSRTAMLALLLGMAVSLAWGLFNSRKETMQLASFRSLAMLTVTVSILSLLLAASPIVSDTMSRFWIKGDERTVEKAFFSSRGAGIVFHWERFLRKPLTGQGFGIDVAHANDQRPSTFLGIPTSASTEKGFLPVAFLEEVGLLGLISLTPFFLILVIAAMKQKDIILTAVFFACLFVNFGEAVFFSPGQLGGYLWLLIGLSTARGWQLTYEA